MTVTLTKTRMIAGVWEGVLDGVTDAPPPIKASHLGVEIEGTIVKRSPDDVHWVVHVPVPAHVLADGVQTFVIVNGDTDEMLNSFSVIAGEALAGDIRAGMELLREELDMLKSAFRRHCVETA